MAIEWNRVTWYSQVVAILLFVGIFALGFWLGMKKEADTLAGAPMHIGGDHSGTAVQEGTPIVADVTYDCDDTKTVRAIYKADSVNLLLSDGRNLVVPQAISASGARYANDDESFVFWNKGTTAFITEGAATTYADCSEVPQPE